MGRKSKEERLKILQDRCEELGYTLITKEYKGNKVKLDIICDKGHEWHPTYDNFIHKNRKCRKCADIQNGINQKESWILILDLVESCGYKMLSKENDYKNQNSKLKTICPNGHEYEFYINNFKKGKRCGKCLMSGGEQEISRVLEKYFINYIFNYRFHVENMRNKPYDFYISDMNTCIEFDGEQHYKTRCFKRDVLDLMNQKYIDNIKTQYCKNNNIRLIRIPYWEFDNIEEILKRELNLK